MMGAGGWQWSQLCGHGENITAWNKNDFGRCFEQLAFACTTHALLAILSAYHFARHSHRQVLGPIPRSLTLHIRFALCVVLAALPLVALVLAYLYVEIHPSLADIITWGIKAASWLIHSGYIWRLCRLYHIHIRGHVIVVISFLLTCASTAIQLRTSILNLLSEATHIITVDDYVTFITNMLHLLYLLSLIPDSRPDLIENSGSIQNADGLQTESETAPLLQSQHRGRYGAVPISTATSDQLGRGDETAGCLSRLTFWWVTPLLLKGSQQHLNSATDLFDLPSRLNIQRIEEKFLEIMHDTTPQKARTEVLVDEVTDPYGDTPAPNSSSGGDVVISDGQRHKKKTLVSALNTAFGIEYYSIGVLKLLADGFTFVGPMLLNWLVTYMEDPTEPSWHGYVYAAGLFLSTFLGSMCSTHFNYLVQIVGLKIRAAIITSIYRKSVLASSVSLSTFSVGEIINFMSTDVDRIVNFCPTFHNFWSLPFQIAVALYFLHQQIGLAFLAGLVFAILLIPVNRWIAIKIAQLSTSMMSHKDGRVKVMNELLTGIRIIKFYLWENHFRTKIGKLRNAELASLRGRKYLDALCVYFWATTPVLISVLTFATYALLGHSLTAAKVFTSMALFNILIMPLNAFPWVINGLMEAWVSVRRVQVFLQLPELDRSKYYTHSQPDASSDSVVTIHQGQFSWSLAGDQEHPTDHPSHGVSSAQSSAEDGHINSVAHARSSTQKLININLNIPKGSIVGVVGTVGSGKSSLLSAITAEMQLEQGLVTVANLGDGFGLAAQEAWIQNASIKDNILFGKPYCEEKYAAVLEACALEDDLKVMPHGDGTEVGENGVTLSGGQKARVALARAVYQDKDLYLLDDPLAAVDAHVAHHLFHKCIMGLLKTKTRVLCTHHTKYLRDVDLVVVMKQGTIVNSGIPSDILGADDLDITANANNSADDMAENKAEDVTADQEQCTGSSSLMQEEEKDTGVVKLHVYKSYWIAVGRILAPMILVSLLLMQGTRNISDWWLSYWVTHSHSSSADHNTSVHPSLSLTHGHTHFLYRHTSKFISPWSNLTESEDNVAYYLAVYGILAGANSFFTLVRAFLFAYGGICAAVRIHKLLLARILKAPVGFFDVTPIGRIMNRFSTDLYSIDDALPFVMNTLFAQSYGLLGTLVITCYGLPWFSLLLVPLGIIYYFIQRYYRQTSREIKRITSVTLSPIYAHFSESITGLTTIRALRETDRFQAENRWRLEQNQRAQFTSQAASQWLGIRLQMIGVAMVTGVALIAVLEHHFRTVNPGLVGLAVSYALSVTGLLNGVVTAFTETEKQMVSVERAGEYITTTPTEKDWAILCAPPYWPIQGAIVFQRVFLRYRPSLPCALSGVCFETKPAEKIGIVGRTGSGKSSLFLALFRIVELEEGQVLIDGINVSHVPLEDLRSRLAIIPQDPFLFSGSVRENLDPEGFCHEEELWDTLQRCYLKDVVERLGGLDAQVAERGRHFSVGQRQLLCLARALLLRAKVLCIDEATASVDRQTDKLIQVTIREQFSDNTVLTIAHRTDTILDSDRVLVMHDGKVVEFAPPGILMQNEKSMFYGLVHGNA